MAADAFTFDGLSALIPPGIGAFDAPCPACGPEPRSPLNRRRRVLRIWREGERYLTYCCARCGATGWTMADGQTVASAPKSAAARAVTPSDAERTARALWLWREAVPPSGTSVDRYLCNRGLMLPPDAAGEAIGFHLRCPFGRAITPAMLALVRDIHTDRSVAIHRTALTPDGRKAEIDGQSRMSLGRIAGGVIKLTPDYAVETALGIGEGIESTLSLRLWPGCECLPVWATLSAGGLAAFPVLPGVEVLWIAADRDKAGLAAAEQVRARWNAAGRDVEIIRPRVEGEDLNDVARRRHG